MRIITGTARGVKLETLEGEATRPTAERVKEAVFSMLQFDLEGRRALDLFAGSGQLGLEALSRGASKATFIDVSKEAADVVKRNAQKAKLYQKTNILNLDYRQFLKSASGREKYDLVFLDPPYAMKAVDECLEKLCLGGILAQNAIIVCESDEAEPFEHEGLTLYRHNKYGKIYITVLTAEPSTAEGE